MYDWLVLLHILGVLGFMFSHGISAAMALRLRHERNADRIRVILQVSGSATGLLYVSILVLLIGGVWAGFSGGWWGQGWIWLALGIFVANLVLMWAYAAPYYKKVREVMTIEESGGSAVGADDLEALLRTNRAIVLSWVGLVSIASIAYLMVLKPF
jgi:hypothetical protein